jgi:HEPN domain-containing protein
MKKATREWARKAESDYRLARTIDGGNEPFNDQLCFHCQQTAEKYLKALLEELGQPVPKTHDLDDLQVLLQPSHPSLRRLRRGLLLLTDFAVDTRYPGNRTSKRQAKAALRWAERIRNEARSLLGVRPPRKRAP